MNSFFCSFFFFYVCVLPWEAFSLPWNLQVGSKFVGKFVKKISSKTSKVFISFSLSFTMLNIAEVQMYIFHFKLFIQHLWFWPEGVELARRSKIY